MTRQLESVEHFEDRGKVRAGCGHTVDVRMMAYIHRIRKATGREVAVETSCLKCAATLSDWPPTSGKAG